MAVGKHGSRPVPTSILPGIREELARAKDTPLTFLNLNLHLLRASFLGSLFVKSVHTPDERAVLSYAVRGDNGGEDVSPAEVLAAIGASSSDELISYALRVLSGERLTMDEAASLGELLYTPHSLEQVSVWVIKALIAHVMRVRHESSEELAGLAEAARRGLSPSFRTPKEGIQIDTGPFVHVAEPFDGTITNDLLTPLLCHRLRDVYGMRPVMSVGLSSGPKYGPNLRDIAQELGLQFCKSVEHVAVRAGEEFGAVVDQSDCSPGLDSWVHMRRVILKRPGIATVEKYVDACPGGAALFIGSAFHAPYIGKMADVAEDLQYGAYIIVGRGMEGTTGLGITARRTANLLTGWRTEDGSFQRKDVEFNVVRDGVRILLGEEEEPVKGSTNAKVSVERIRRFAETGRSGSPFFDARAKATLQAFDMALSVLKENGVSFLRNTNL